MTQAVLFDLDGTLADTALDLGGALNTVLHRHGLPEKSMDEIRPQASHGASGLLNLVQVLRPTIRTICNGAKSFWTNTAAAMPTNHLVRRRKRNARSLSSTRYPMGRYH